MNAGDACSGGPSGVGLSSCAGTVASRRARLGRTEVRHAKRAGAGEASMPPPNPLESWTYHLKPALVVVVYGLRPGGKVVPECPPDL